MQRKDSFVVRVCLLRVGIDTFTYGDYSGGSKSCLDKMSREHGPYLLAFYAELRAPSDSGRGALYLIGYFEVTNVKRTNSHPQSLRSRSIKQVFF